MEVRLSREMRLMDITMIGVGAMIGAGIFVLTGSASGIAGPAVLITFFLNGIIALLVAMAYAELGSAFHDAGGGYLWVKTSLPDPNGFLGGWMSWFAHAVACSLYALGFGGYFRMVLEAFGAPHFQLGFMTLDKWLAVVVVVVFGWINFRGASETGKAGNVVTVSKVAIIGLFIVAGVWAMFHRPHWEAAFRPVFANGWSGVFAAMGLTFIAFEGYEIIAQTSEEVENPKRNVPRAVFLSLLIVIPIYLLVAFVAFGATRPPEGTTIAAYLGSAKELALVHAADQFVTGGGVVLMVGGLLSTLSALNATIYSSSRVAFAMARDANLPPFIGKIHEKRNTPATAIFFSSLIVLAMAILLPLEEVAAASDIMFLLLFVQVNIAVIRLRKRRPDLDRGFKIPWMPFTPIVAICAMLFLAVFLFVEYPLSWLAAGVWIACGVGVYYFYSRHREEAAEERERWMERLERKQYRVLVAVSSPRTMRSLMEVAIAIARKHDGSIVVMSVAEVPEGELLFAGRPKARQLEGLLEEAVEYARERDVDAEPVVKIARRISHAIIETARETGSNLLIIGQASTRSFVERIVASIVEHVLKDAPCQVGVLYGAIAADGIRRIVVPITRGANSELAAQLAPAFAERYDAPVRAVTIVPNDFPEAEALDLAKGASEALATANLETSLDVTRSADIVRGLVHTIRRGDLVLLGAPSDGPISSVLGQTVPSALAERRRNPIVVVREVEERSAGRFERLFFAANE